jgi:hypothetical protein
LTRFLDANRPPPRIKSGAGFRLKTLQAPKSRMSCPEIGQAAIGGLDARFSSVSLRRRNVDTVSQIFTDLVSQRANGDAEHTRRRGTISIGAGKCLEHEIALDVSDGQTDQPSRNTAS